MYCKSNDKKNKNYCNGLATSNTDMSIEEKIQKALDIVFKYSTVITVAQELKQI
jgi:ABC-type transport system involved in Fe-S cluster assembly fused permease/ATPase subunit